MTRLNPTRDPGPDQDAVERLLMGVVAPDDAPPEYRYAASLLDAARAAPGPTELALENDMVAAAAAELAPARGLTSASSPVRFPRVAGRRVAVALAATAAGCLVSGSLALAGALPDGVQRPLARALNRVGISIPAPASVHPSITAPGPSGASGAGAGSCRTRSCASHSARPGRAPAVGLVQPASSQAPTTLAGATPDTPGAHPQLPNLPTPPSGKPLPPPSIPPAPRQGDPTHSLPGNPPVAGDLGLASKTDGLAP